MTVHRHRLGARVAAGLATLAAAALLLATPAAAAPAPAFSIRSLAQPTNFSGALDRICEMNSTSQNCDSYTLLVTNIGNSTATPPLTISDILPAGVSPVHIEGIDLATGEHIGPCSEVPLQCIDNAEVPAGDTLMVTINVVVNETLVSHPAINTAEVAGGGAPPASVTEETAIGSEPAPFGIHGFGFQALDAAGVADTQAGGHPYTLTTSFDFATTNAATVARTGYHSTEEVKDVFLDLPPGFLGNPQAAPKCPLHALVRGARGVGCPPASRIGKVVFEAAPGAFRASEGFENDVSAFYNLQPEAGYPAEFGFTYLSRTVIAYASLLRSGSGYLLRATVSGVPTIEAVGAWLTLFGDPAQRDGLPSGPPFFTNPSDCQGGSSEAKLEVDSWENPGLFHAATSNTYPEVSGCEALRFEPTFTLTPDTTTADSPTGPAVDLHVPQAAPELDQLATPPLRDATVTLPQGLDVNPSSADGLAGCAAQGPNGINVGSSELTPQGRDLGDPEATELGAGHAGGNGSPYDDGLYHTAPGHCPLASQIGTVEVATPLLAEPLHGRVYLGAPECAPCTNQDAAEGKLLKLYIEAAGQGVIVKLPGTVSADPATGRLTATFKDNPQLPFEDLRLHFKTGARAPLRTPATCGSFTTTTELTPWSGNPAAEPEDSFNITSGPNGAPCATTPAQEPNQPSFEAGTLVPQAGSYSPFVLKLSREDGSQELKAIDTTLPPGLSGKLAGVQECSAAQLTAAEQRSGEAEQASPSCPLASQLGTVNVGAGAGPSPFYVQGHAYLSGPYKSAPLSLAIITPALAGPFDLGTVLVRTALYVNPQTAQIHAVSDPIPTILDGIPLDLRSIALNMDRGQFTLNPTNCDPLAITGSALSLQSQSAALSNPFQVGGCPALGFKPKLSLALKGATKRTGHPALRATLTARAGDANIAKAQVTLPHSEFLDNAHIQTVCTRVQFAASQCPPGSIYGFARATTPLLDQPLEGPVYLRSSSHKLPDLVAALNGQIQVALDGKVDTGKNGGIRNSFEVVPDAPVSKFTLSMQGGNKGLLVNSEDLCSPKAKTHAVVNLTAQSGRVYDTTPAVANSCSGKGKSRSHHRKGKG